MALNKIKDIERWVDSVVCSDPAIPASGDPVRYGLLTGVALNAESTANNPTGYTSVDFGPRVWNLSVKGVDGSGNSAVAVGDSLFYVDADTPKLSKKAAGYFFGIAQEAVGSSLTATIKVLKCVTPAGGTLAAGGVGTTQLASAGVTAAKLSSTLKTGFINLPLTAMRVVASNDVPASGTPDGGVLSVDTAPKLIRLNAATDKALRVLWAASSSVEIILGQFAYPPDLDEAAAVTVNVIAYMGGATDTPTLAIGYFENVGDTNAGGNTAALSATAAKKSVSIAAGDVGALPATATVTLTPGAHTTDSLTLLAAWVEYTRA